MPLLRSACGLGALLALVLAAPAAQARDTTVVSFDGTPIVTSFHPAQGLRPASARPPSS